MSDKRFLEMFIDFSKQAKINSAGEALAIACGIAEGLKLGYIPVVVVGYIKDNFT